MSKDLTTKGSLLLLLLLLTSLHSYQVIGQVTIERASITIEFVSKDVSGSIEGFESNSRIFPGSPERSVLEGSVAVETLETGNFLRDWSLKKSKYFNEDEFPRIYYRSSRIDKDGDYYIVEGTLSMKGVSRPLTFRFKAEDDKWVGEAELYSSDYGVQIRSDRKKNLVKISLSFYLSTS